MRVPPKRSHIDDEHGDLNAGIGAESSHNVRTANSAVAGGSYPAQTTTYVLLLRTALLLRPELQNGQVLIWPYSAQESPGGRWEKTLADLRAAAKEIGTYFLENDSIEIDGLRFLGCSLWTDFEYFQHNRIPCPAVHYMLLFVTNGELSSRASGRGRHWTVCST